MEAVRDRPVGPKWAAHLYRRAAFGAKPRGAPGSREARPREHARPAAPGSSRTPPTSFRRSSTSAESPRRATTERHRTPRLVALLHAARRPPAPREADAVLAQPLRHQHRQGARRDPDVPPELPAARARARQVRPVASGDQPRRRHARLARLQQQREGQAERELRPRADGAVHPRRRQLHREGRPRGRPGLHRLAHRRRSGFTSMPRLTTTDRRRCSARPATGTAATWSESSWSSPPRRGSSSASSTPASSARSPPPDALLEPLCESFRKSDYDVAAVLRTMLSSRLFYSDHAFRKRIKSPVEYVLGAVQAIYRSYDEADPDYRPLPHQRTGSPADRDGADAVRAAERQGLAGRPRLAEHLDRARAQQLRRGTCRGQPLVGRTRIVYVCRGIAATQGARPGQDSGRRVRPGPGDVVRVLADRLTCPAASASNPSTNSLRSLPKGNRPGATSPGASARPSTRS